MRPKPTQKKPSPDASRKRRNALEAAETQDWVNDVVKHKRAGTASPGQCLLVRFQRKGKA